jgi:hypothetical protein
MKKITLNEEVTRMQEMMGITHTSPSGKRKNMSPEDDTIEELSPTDIVGSMREEETDENTEVKDKFKDQYGKKKGEEVYYATANKQDRDPETFEKNEESAIGGWDLAMEEDAGVPSDTSDKLDYLEDLFSKVYKMGRLEAPVDFKMLAKSTVNDMFGDEEENTYEIPGFEGTTDALDNLTIREEEKSFMETRGGKDGPVYENEEMGEARKIQQETYFETQAGALESAEEYAKNKGYTVNWESINPEHVAYGQTVSYSVELMVKEVKIKVTELGIIELNKYGGFTADNYEKTFSSQSGGRTKSVTQPTDFFTNSGTGKVFTLSFDFNENTLKMYSQGEFLASFKFKSLKPGEEDDRGWFKIVGDSKDGTPARKMLQISLYRMESGRYELTNYIN